MKKVFIGFMVVSAWLALGLASGEILVPMHIVTELIIRISLVCFFGLVHFCLHIILTKNPRTDE